jgi:hypothetical protein
MTKPKNPRIPASFRKQFKVNSVLGCWEWQGAYASGNGIDGVTPLFTFKGDTHKAHRWIYERLCGPLSGAECLYSMCNDSMCVYPLHRRPGLPGATNSRERHAARRQLVADRHQALKAAGIL